MRPASEDPPIRLPTLAASRKFRNLLMPETTRDWEERYRQGELPWDSGRPSAELVKLIDGTPLPGRRVLELGCGTGTNAIWMAKAGCEVTALDLSATALELARAKAQDAGAAVDWGQADVTDFDAGGSPFDFVFDRGCYHCCRTEHLEGYLATHRRATRPGSLCLILAGNPDDGATTGPPRVPAAVMLAELEPLYRLQRLAAFQFEDRDGTPGPLGWSCLLQRR